MGIVPSDTGIFARSDGVDGDGLSLSIMTEGNVTGGVNGIVARNYGAGALSIVANGDKLKAQPTSAFMPRATVSIRTPVRASASSPEPARASAAIVAFMLATSAQAHRS
jgi:hypothetical protein